MRKRLGREINIRLSDKTRGKIFSSGLKRLRIAELGLLNTVYWHNKAVLVNFLRRICNAKTPR